MHSKSHTAWLGLSSHIRALSSSAIQNFIYVEPVGIEFMLKWMPCCLHKLSFSSWGTHHSARLVCFLFCFMAICILYMKSKENFSPQLGKRGVREASRSHYNPKAASKSHLLPRKLQLLRVAFRFCVHLSSIHFILSSYSGAQRLGLPLLPSCWTFKNRSIQDHILQHDLFHRD